MSMRVSTFVAAAVSLMGCGATMPVPGVPDARSRTPLWYRGGGEEPSWAFYRIDDSAKQRAVADLQGRIDDARRLEARPPEGVDWQHDPVIARIRLHRSRRPDRVAWSILEHLDSNPAERLDAWPAHLYRCELLRYLSFGDDLRYRNRIEGFLRRGARIVCTDQETYPNEIDSILEAWLDSQGR